MNINEKIVLLDIKKICDQKDSKQPKTLFKEIEEKIKEYFFKKQYEKAFIPYNDEPNFFDKINESIENTLKNNRSDNDSSIIKELNNLSEKYLKYFVKNRGRFKYLHTHSSNRDDNRFSEIEYNYFGITLSNFTDYFLQKCKILGFETKFEKCSLDNLFTKSKEDYFSYLNTPFQYYICNLYDQFAYSENEQEQIELQKEICELEKKYIQYLRFVLNGIYYQNFYYESELLKKSGLINKSFQINICEKNKEYILIEFPELGNKIDEFKKQINLYKDDEICYTTQCIKLARKLFPEANIYRYDNSVVKNGNVHLRQCYKKDETNGSE